MIEAKTARAIGVDRHAPPQVIAEYLCRQADRRPIPTLPARAAEWFVGLAQALGQHLPERQDFDPAWSDSTPSMPGDAVAKEVAVSMAGRLRRPDAPAVLAAIAPDVIVGGCPARDLERLCRGLVGRNLETFCLRIVENWAQEGYIRD